MKEVFAIFAILFLFSAKDVLAVDVVINNPPASIGNEEFNIDLTINGANLGTNYLRIDLFKDGTSNYFGETFNGTSWNKDSNGTNYLPVQIQDASASATVKGRLGNPSAGDYPGPGSYKLKIRRYTSESSYTFSDPINIQITYSTPTPSPTPTPKPTVKPSPTPDETEEPESTPEVLSTTTENDETPEPEEETETDASENKFPIAAIPLIGGGVGMVGFATYPFIKDKLNMYNERRDSQNSQY